MDGTLQFMTLYAEHRGIALSTLGRLVGSSSLVSRLAEGRVTIATAARVRQ